MTDTQATQLLEEMRLLRGELDGLRADLAARRSSETSVGPIKLVAPEAFNLEETCRMLGGLSGRHVKRLIDAGHLDRVPAVRRILVTRRSIERYSAGRS